PFAADHRRAAARTPIRPVAVPPPRCRGTRHRQCRGERVTPSDPRCDKVLTSQPARSDNCEVEVPAEVGSTANRYQILGKLAAGGMAEIFLARGVNATGLERYCVLKRILRERAGDAQFVRMFLDEARLAAQLQHPNIASVYDIGMLGDSYFFTMEYVHGETV